MAVNKNNWLTQQLQSTETTHAVSYKYNFASTNTHMLISYITCTVTKQIYNATYIAIVGMTVTIYKM